MPIILSQNINHDSKLIIWKIIEETEYFTEVLNTTQLYQSQFSKFSSELRKKQWLCARNIINSTYGNDVSISYNDNGKPILSNSINISISHCKEFVTVLLSTKKQVGVDIEIQNYRIEKLIHKFMNTSEIRLIRKTEHILYYYIHWCTKEVICKLFDYKLFDFTNDIIIKSISEEKKEILAEVYFCNKKYNIICNYFTFEKCIIVLALK